MRSSSNMNSLLVFYILSFCFNDFFFLMIMLLFTLNKNFFLDMTEEFLRSKNIINFFINKLMNETVMDIAIILFSFSKIYKCRKISFFSVIFVIELLLSRSFL